MIGIAVNSVENQKKKINMRLIDTWLYLQGIIPWATNWLIGLLNINLTLRAETKNKSIIKL